MEWNSSNLTIRRMTDTELEPYKEAGKAEGLLFGNGIEFYGAYAGDKLMGYYGFKRGKRSGIIKCDYTFLEYRKQGLLTRMILYRIAVAKLEGLWEVSAHCTPASYNAHVGCGAKLVHEYVNGIKKVVYRL